MNFVHIITIIFKYINSNPIKIIVDKRTTDKIRIESNNLKPGFTLSSEHRATNSAYDTAPSDSNKVGIWFAPTDVINNDIINSVGNLNFEDYF